jgi:hypothetical protein
MARSARCSSESRCRASCRRIVAAAVPLLFYLGRRVVSIRVGLSFPLRVHPAELIRFFAREALAIALLGEFVEPPIGVRTGVGLGSVRSSLFHEGRVPVARLCETRLTAGRMAGSPRVAYPDSSSAGSSMDRASDYGSEGWGFDSLPARRLVRSSLWLDLQHLSAARADTAVGDVESSVLRDGDARGEEEALIEHDRSLA